MKRLYTVLLSAAAVLGANTLAHVVIDGEPFPPAPIPSVTPRPSPTPNKAPIVTPTPQPTPRPSVAPTPTPADVIEARKRFAAYMKQRQNEPTYYSGSGGTHRTTTAGGETTYDESGAGPAVHEFGDASGISWVDQYTFQNVGPTPATWSDVQHTK